MMRAMKALRRWELVALSAFVVAVPVVVTAVAAAQEDGRRPDPISYEEERAMDTISDEDIADARAWALETATQQGRHGQVKILSDRVPTTGDYMTAMSRTLECIRAGGFEVVDVETEWEGLKLSYAVLHETPEPEVPQPSRLEDEDPATQAHQQCYLEHAYYVDVTYSTAVSPRIYELERDVVECIRELGVDVSQVEHPASRRVADAAEFPLVYLLNSLGSEGRVAAQPCLEEI